MNDKRGILILIALIAMVILTAFYVYYAAIPTTPVAPVAPVPVTPDEPPVPPVPNVLPDRVPLPLEPVEPEPLPEPVLTPKPHTAALAVCNRVAGQECRGSGILIKHAGGILAVTSRVLFLAGIGEVTVTDTRGRVYVATVATLDEERYVVALHVTDLGDAVYTTLKPHSFQVGPKDYWAYGCEGNTFSGVGLYVAFHPLPSPSWTVFDAPAAKVRSVWFGSPILDTDGQLAGLLLGRAGPYRDQAIGINTTELMAMLGDQL
jgi:hypothetical protein